MRIRVGIPGIRFGIPGARLRLGPGRSSLSLAGGVVRITGGRRSRRRRRGRAVKHLAVGLGYLFLAPVIVPVHVAKAVHRRQQRAAHRSRYTTPSAAVSYMPPTPAAPWYEQPRPAYIPAAVWEPCARKAADLRAEIHHYTHTCPAPVLPGPEAAPVVPPMPTAPPTPSRDVTRPHGGAYRIVPLPGDLSA